MPLALQPFVWLADAGLALGMGGSVAAPMVELLPFSVLTLWLYVALRRLYAQPAWAVVGKSVVLTAVMVGVLQLDRLVLFLITFYAV